MNVFEGERSRYSVPALATPIENIDLNTIYGFIKNPELGGTGGEVWTLAEIQGTPPYKQIKQFDQFGAAAIVLISFSPDNHYLAFRTRWGIGSGMVFALWCLIFKTAKQLMFWPKKANR